MAGERLAGHRAGAEHEVQHARRQRLAGQLDIRAVASGVISAGFRTIVLPTAIARGELHHRLQQQEVPGRDPGDDPVWLADEDRGRVAE